jgi:hypothetical protein
MAECEEESTSCSEETESVEVDSQESDGVQGHDWHQNPLFSRYWKQYNQTQAWAKAWASNPQSSSVINSVTYEQWYLSMAEYHRQCAAYMQQCGMQYMQMASSLMGFKVPEVPQQKPLSPNKKKRKKRKKSSQHKEGKKQHKTKPKKKYMLFSDLEDISDMELVLDVSGNLTDPEGTEYHMEISEDMLEFFAQSARHKLERGQSQS